MNKAVTINKDKAKPRATYLRQFELVDRVKAYDPSVDEALLNKAYVFSVKAHGEQKRHSGDPYYAHPIEVAGIVADLHLDVASVCTALLHDVIEDTDTTCNDLAELFTPEIAELVNGVTKLGQLSMPNATREQAQAENFQKFVLAMSKDVRVLLVKLCDRLHNMRTLNFHPKEASRKRIATETSEIYAPLARRVGMDKICAELEDLSFRYMHPNAYESLERRLKDWRETQGEAISEISTALRHYFDEEGPKARIYGREKRTYAIWKKLQRQSISFEDVADIYAFRVIVETREDCYQALGLLHSIARAMPDRFRDFISVPKPNGYQSLHTTIRTPDNRRVEIQIRTERMEDVAERGVAAHWAYKDESYGYDADKAKSSGSDPLKRIRRLVEIMDQSGDASEFLEHAKMEMFKDQVFTFTPKGDLIALPKGAMPLDFAYAVHTKVGDTCIGALVNERKHSLRKPLRNGDVVKIIRGGAPEAPQDWHNLVVTGKARAALRRLTRTGETEEFIKTGELLVKHAFTREKLTFSDHLMTDAVKRGNYETLDDLLVAIGRGEVSLTEVMELVYPARKEKREITEDIQRDVIMDATAPLYIKGNDLRPGVSIHFSDCCSPIPGDRIIGLQAIHADRGGIDIHTIDCETLSSTDVDPDTWIDLAWRRSADNSTAIGRLGVTVEHVPGALAELARIVGEASGNLVNIKTVKRSPILFDMIMDMEVRDNRHLIQIIAALRASAYVVAVDRLRDAVITE